MATLTVIPSEIKDLETEYSTEIIKFENEYEQRFANSHTGVKHFLFKWNSLTPDERTSLQSFFDDQLGMFRQWDLTDSRLGSTDITYLRFNSDKIKFEPIKHKVFNAEIKVTTC